MKIVIVASSGASLVNFRGELIKSWIKLGNEVVCVSIETAEEMENKIQELGATYYQVSGSRTGTSVFDGVRMINDYKKAFKIIKPDICFLYMSKPIAFGGVAAVRTHVPHINILISGLENAYYRTGFKDKIVCFIMSFSYRFVSAHADNVFIQNNDDYNYFIDNKLSAEEKTWLVNGSGVDMKYYARQPLPKKPVVLMVARLLWSKGIREFTDAVSLVKKKHPDVRIMLVGGLDKNAEALSEEELNAWVKESSVEYVGYSSDVREYLNECSIFVLPSYHEGTPRSVLEAMATARPIITTDVPGCRETVIDGENGFLVPARNSTVLAEKMITLIENDKLRETMAEKSYRLCMEKYDVHKVNNSINEVVLEFDHKED